MLLTLGIGHAPCHHCLHTFYPRMNAQWQCLQIGRPPRHRPPPTHSCVDHLPRSSRRAAGICWLIGVGSYCWRTRYGPRQHTRGGPSSASYWVRNSVPFRVLPIFRFAYFCSPRPGTARSPETAVPCLHPHGMFNILLFHIVKTISRRLL